MHLRRALLLFAIVLGLAAVAASVSRPRSSSDPLRRRHPPRPRRTKPTATAAPKAVPGADRADLRRGQPARARDPSPGRPRPSIVKVRRPGRWGSPASGMSDEAEPLTPAHFDVLTQTPGAPPDHVRASGRRAGAGRSGRWWSRTSGEGRGGDRRGAGARWLRERRALEHRLRRAPGRAADRVPLDHPRPPRRRAARHALWAAQCPPELVNCRTASGRIALRGASGSRRRRGRALRADLPPVDHAAGRLGDRRGEVAAPPPAAGAGRPHQRGRAGLPWLVRAAADPGDRAARGRGR